MQDQIIHELSGKQAKLATLYPDDETANSAPTHRLSVLEFGMKGLTGRMTDMEATNGQLAERVQNKIDSGHKDLDVLTEKTKVEMRDISHEQKLQLKNMLSEITLDLNNKMTDFTDNILIKGKVSKEREKKAAQARLVPTTT